MRRHGREWTPFLTPSPSLSSPSTPPCPSHLAPHPLSDPAIPPPPSYGLTAEEKMRRRWREWSAAGLGDASSPSSPPSYSELLSSFRRVVAADEADKAGELDVRSIVSDPSVLPDALALSKDSVIEWMEVQESLVQRQEKAKDKQFLFKVKAA